MTRTLIIIILALAICTECYAGYTVHVDQQRQEFTTVNGPYGPESYPASAEVTTPPTMGAELCRPANYSVFVNEASRRSRVFADTYGVATLSDILAVCPDLKKNMIDQARRSVSATLAQTDYMVIKEVEVDGYTMPAEIKAARQALRDRFNAYEQSINTASTIEELLATTWK